MLKPLCLAAAALAGSAVAQDARYVAATSLNLRAAPDASAAVAARWRLNQPVQLLAERGRWCEVAAPGGTPRGHVDCAYLQRAPVTRAQVESDATAAGLALLRLGGIDDWTSAFTRDAPEARRQLEQLFTQLDRHFALSPSLHVYREADALTAQLAPQQPEQEAQRPLHTARLAQLAAMRAAFSADFARDPRETVPHGALRPLAALIDQRQARLREGLGERPLPRPLAASFFGGERWAMGWAAGPLATALPGRGPDGVPHAVRFDGTGVVSLAPVFEMAKAQRAAVRATWGRLKAGGHELAQAAPGAAGHVETLRLDTRLGAWAVTADGLRPAQVLGAQFEGGACSGEGASTHADVRVAGSTETPLAVFATNAPLDPARAKVQLEKRRFLAPLSDLFENTLTERVTLTVDLDADGVPDLRVVISQDTAVGQGRAGPRRVAMRPVAGWYAHDVYSLEANVEGEWKPLSVYQVVTCT